MVFEAPVSEPSGSWQPATKWSPDTSLFVCGADEGVYFFDRLVPRAPFQPAPLVGRGLHCRGHDRAGLLSSGGGGTGSMGGDTRADLFEDDLFDLPGEAFGDFHILQNMSGLGHGV